MIFRVFLYLENYVVTSILDFWFSFDHYETQDSDVLTYEDSKRVYVRSTYDHYFPHNRRNKKLTNALRDYSYNLTSPYGVRLFNVLSNNYFELFFRIYFSRRVAHYLLM